MIKKIFSSFGWDLHSGQRNVERHVTSPSEKGSTSEEMPDVLKPLPEEKIRIAHALVATKDPKKRASLMRKLVPGERNPKGFGAEVFTKKEKEWARGKSREELQPLFSEFLRRRP